MRKSFKFNPPNPTTDDGIIRIFLVALSSLILLIMGGVLVFQIDKNNIVKATIIALGMLPILVALALSYYRLTEQSGAALAVSLTILVTVLATLGQGVYDIGTMAYPAILIISSLILRRNTVIGLTGLIILCNGWLVFGAIFGVYLPDYLDQSYTGQFVFTTMVLIVTMSAVYLLSESARNSLISAQNELQERRRVEQALRDTEIMYRALVEKTSVVIYRDMPNKAAETIYISPQIEDLLGYTPAEWRSKPDFWQSTVHPDDLSRVLDEIQKYITTGEKTISEYRMKTKSGQWMWARDESVIVKDENGEIQYVHGVYVDITERKTAEKKLKQREAILSAVAETAQLLLKSTNWREEINSILKLLGEATGASHAYIFENHPGQDGRMRSSQIYEWAAPGMQSELNNPVYQDTILDPIPGIEEWHRELSAGRPFYGSGLQYPEFWEKLLQKRGIKTILEMPIFVDREWWGVIGFDDFVHEMPWSMAEINALVASAGNLGTAIERQRYVEALRRSEEKFELAFHHTYVAMAINKVSDMTLLDVNDAFCKITGHSRDESIGKRAGRDLKIWVHQEDRDTVFSMLEQHGYIDEYKAEFQRKDGEIRTGLLSAVNISLLQEPCQLYTFVDISNIEQLLTELEAKNDELLNFTYTVSHDLRSPLVTISGYIGFLAEDALNGNLENLNKDIERINEGIVKMDRLLTELLELSRIGRLINPAEDFPFGEVVTEALELVQGRLVANQVQVRVEADLPFIYGDRMRLVQVVQNLIDNAAKFTAGRENPLIEIGVDNINGEQIFYVRDNGMGIEPIHFERIFGLFNKLNVDIDGTGIGLALVKRIIEIHGGKIWVKSEPGNGSTFYFTIENKVPEETG